MHKNATKCKQNYRNWRKTSIKRQKLYTFATYHGSPPPCSLSPTLAWPHSLMAGRVISFHKAQQLLVCKGTSKKIKSSQCFSWKVTSCGPWEHFLHGITILWTILPETLFNARAPHSSFFCKQKEYGINRFWKNLTKILNAHKMYSMIVLNTSVKSLIHLGTQKWLQAHLLFLCSIKYKVFRIEILHACRIHL
jgi:hypothetical protein